MLPLLLVVYAVVMGGAALFDSLGDASGGLALRWVGTILALLFTATSVVLLLVLAWNQLLLDADRSLEEDRFDQDAETP